MTIAFKMDLIHGHVIKDVSGRIIQGRIQKFYSNTSHVALTAMATV